MTPDEIKQALDTLAEYQAQAQLLELDRVAEYERIIAPLKDELNALEAEYADKSETVADKIAKLSEQIKAAVIQHGAKVETDTLAAVYRKGTEKWDGEKLKGLALVYPEIGACHSYGMPSVAIQARKGK